MLLSFLLLLSLELIFVNRFSQAQNLSRFREKMLNDHNEFWKQHHSPPLQLNVELNDVAQHHAQHLTGVGKLEHSQGKYGENLYAISGVNANNVMTHTYFNPVGAWYSGISIYPGGSHHDLGHFTQIVWKNSTYLGCGMASKDAVVYVVCNYGPPGNVAGLFDKNVLIICEDSRPCESSLLVYLIVLGLLIFAIIFGIFVVYGIKAFNSCDRLRGNRPSETEQFSLFGKFVQVKRLTLFRNRSVTFSS